LASPKQQANFLLNHNMQSLLNKIMTAIVDGLGIPRTTAATVMLTLSTFCLGYLLTWGASYIVKLKKRRLYRKSLKIIITDFLNSCEKQYLEFENFFSQPGYLNGGNYTVSFATSYSYNYLAKTDIVVFIENFSSIFHRNRAVEISQLFEVVERVAAAKETLKRVSDFVQARYDENFNTYNESLDNLRKGHDDIIFELVKGDRLTEPNGYQHNVLRIFSAWKNKGASTHINSTLSEIVDPIYQLATTTATSMVSQNIINYTLKCRLAAENLRKHEEYLKETVAGSLRIHKDAVVDCSDFIKSW